jgi:hypothetical protein
MLDDSESSPETSAIDDLVADQIGGSEPSPSQEAASTVEAVVGSPDAVSGVSGGEQPSQVQAVAETPNAELIQPPIPQTIRIGDRDYTQQELQAALTSAQQLPHLQSKYVNALEQMRQSQQQPVQQANTQPQVNPQQFLAGVKAKYEPEISKLVKDGMISSDFAQLFPNELSQMLMYRDGYTQLAQRQAQTEQFIQAQTQQSQSQGLMSDIGRSINALAQSGEAFAPLKDPGQVQGFFSYLWDLNPQMGHLKNPDFLAKQWVAYNSDKYLQNAQSQAVNQARQNQVRLAQGAAATGTRAPGMMSEPQKSPLDLLTDDFFQRSA